jgi:hypothetical protein
VRAGADVTTAIVSATGDASEPLAQTWTPKMKEATNALEMAFTQRNDTVKALAPLQTSVVLLIDDVNRELDRLEGDLKKVFPASPIASSRTWRSRATIGHRLAPTTRLRLRRRVR